MALFAVLMSFGFTACSSDGDDNGGGGENTPTVSKRLIKVTMEKRYSTLCDEYTYDSKGRVVKVVNKENGDNSGHIIYTYSDNLIVKKQYNTGSYNEQKTEYVLENGLIVEENHTSGYDYKYSYDNGFLATLEYLKPGTRKGGQYNYTWKDGNLQSLKTVNSESGYSYEYTNYVTPQNFFYVVTIQNFVLEIYPEFVDGELTPFYGKSPKNLPSKRIEVSTNTYTTEKVTYTTSYDWTVKDGLPIRLIVTEPGQSNSSTTIIDFEWE